MDSTEQARNISPIVGETVIHNTRILSNIRSFSSLFIGLVAGLLSLESYTGFLFFAGTAAVVEFVLLPLWVRSSTAAELEKHHGGSSSSSREKPKQYFDDPLPSSHLFPVSSEPNSSAWRTGALGDWQGAVMQYVLTWTLVYGIVTV